MIKERMWTTLALGGMRTVPLLAKIYMWDKLLHFR
jgi:hypothetical protein